LLTAQLRSGEADYSIFKAVILNDSLMYDGSLWIAIKVDQLDLKTAIAWFRSYPTLLPMTLTAYFLQSLGIAGVVFNLLLLMFIAWFVLQIARIEQLGFPYFSLAFVFLNTMTVYFSQSYTKEIPLLLFFVTLLFGVSAKKRHYVVFSMIGIGLIRVYFLPPLLLFFFCRTIQKKWPTFPLLRCLLVLFLMGAIFGPLLLAGNPFILAAHIMQANLNATSGVAHNYLKFIEYPVIPVLFLPVKILQNLFEPLLVKQSGFGNASIDMAHVAAMGCAILHVFFCVYLMSKWRNVKFFLARLSKPNRRLEFGLTYALLFMLGTSLIMYSLLPYVQMRYLYPLIPGFGFILDIVRSQKLESERSV